MQEDRTTGGAADGGRAAGNEIDSTGGASWLLTALWIGIVLVYAVILAVTWPRTGTDDYDQFLVFHELQYWGSSLFGMAKQWTPVMCGGLSMAGNPQVPFLSLGMILGYVLGPLNGLKLATVLYLIMGWVGAYLYSGFWLKRRVRLLAASLFIGNGFFLARFSHGHVDFFPFLCLPLVLWLMHRAAAWDRQRLGLPGLPRLLLAMLLLGALIGVVVDGAPVAFVHLLVWIGLYALVLAVSERTAAPLLVLGGALAVASLLDAGYLWPMLVAQQEFPRLTPDRFTSPASLVWFMLLPVRGKLIPAPANGHELSVYIGPVIALAIWRYRKALRIEVARELRAPLLIVSVASIWLGMGSLRLLHVPVWLSPFDMLRELPGFRSMGVTGRYWGFLAVPLCLFGAAALAKVTEERGNDRGARRLIALALVFQLGFQAESIGRPLLFSPVFRPVAYQPIFPRGGLPLEYVEAGRRNQGELVTPMRGVIDCYDMDDFVRPAMSPGTELIRSVSVVAGPSGTPINCRAGFLSWSRMRIVRTYDAAPSGPDRPRAVVRVVLNQAYHAYWTVSGGASLSASDQGNLSVVFPLERLARGPIDLEFRDPVSDAGAAASVAAWQAWLASVALLAGLAACARFARLRGGSA